MNLRRSPGMESRDPCLPKSKWWGTLVVDLFCNEEGIQCASVHKCKVLRQECLGRRWSVDGIAWRPKICFSILKHNVAKHGCFSFCFMYVIDWFSLEQNLNIIKRQAFARTLLWLLLVSGKCFPNYFTNPWWCMGVGVSCNFRHIYWHNLLWQMLSHITIRLMLCLNTVADVFCHNIWQIILYDMAYFGPHMQWQMLLPYMSIYDRCLCYCW